MKEDKLINTLFMVLIVIFLGFLTFALGHKISEEVGKSEQSIDLIYPTSAVVVATDLMTDTVILDDGQNTWVLLGVEDWDVGDCVSLIMSTNGTPEIEDDIIVKARFSALVAK